MSKHHHNPFMYALHEFSNQGIRAYFSAMSVALSYQRTLLQTVAAYGLTPGNYASEAHKLISASQEISARLSKDYSKPEFGLRKTHIGNETISVTEDVVLDKPFCNLVHFKRHTDRNDPKLLIVAPMSGHHATLLRDTVAQMLPAHDVYITDWKDAKIVPYEAGEFGFDDYVTYVKDFIKQLGENVHVLAVCQPTVPSLAAVARLADEKSPVQPLSLTLMGGPIDVSAAPTEVSDLANQHSMGWFAKNMVGRVPNKYPGGGRLVLPGFLQLFSFVSMNPERHHRSHQDLFTHAYNGDDEKADKIKNFYDEYFAVCDLPGKFYLETVERVFKERELARGLMKHDGKKVDPAAITKTAILTIEGEKDDISPPGHTIAAHGLLTGLPAEMKFNLLQKDAGHYGIFSGSMWRKNVAPRVTGFIRKAGEKAGLKYDKPPENAQGIMPDNFAALKKTPAVNKKPRA